MEFYNLLKTLNGKGTKKTQESIKCKTTQVESKENSSFPDIGLHAIINRANKNVEDTQIEK